MKRQKGSPTKVPAIEPCDAVEPDTDFVGRDIASVAGASTNDCCQACQREFKCNAYSFFQGIFYLKSSRAKVSSLLGVTTARVNKCSVMEVGVDCIENDLASAAAASIEDCCALCRNDNGCDAFTFGWGTCYLKKPKELRRLTRLYSQRHLLDNYNVFPVGK